MGQGEQSDILYDNDCNFCKKVVLFIHEKDKKKYFSSQPIQEIDSRQKLRKLGLQFINFNTIYFMEGEKYYSKSTAVFRIFLKLPYPYKLFSAFRILPTPFTDFFYDQVAKYRHRIIK